MVKCCKPKKRKLLPIIISAVLLSVAAVFLYFRLTVVPIIKTISEDEIRALTVTTMSNSVTEVLGNNPAYLDMVAITYDNDNNISSIKIKSSVVNEIVQKITVESQTNLSKVGKRGIAIPLGSLTGFMSFSGKGPDVNVQIIPVGTVSAKLLSEFTEVGINQTNHRIYLKLNAKVNIILPGANNTVNVATDVPVIDSIIVGKIPQTYLNSTNTQDMMDLIP